MATSDYYEILGVAKNASQEEIKKAFRKIAARLHPDNKETGNESRFKELVSAYEVLSSEEKRAVYDQYGVDGLKRGAAYEPFDMGAFADLGEIFEYFFGGGGHSHARNRAAVRGGDLRYDLSLNFHEAVFGVEKKVNIKHLRPCTACSGSGAAPGSKATMCVACGGHGQVRQTTATLFGQFSQIISCSACQGEGTCVEKACEGCKGRGLLRQERLIELKIPPGVDTGSRIRVTGEGDSGKKGVSPGDLYVIVHVDEHEKFIRDGVTIHLKQPISMSMAALGGEMLVDTVGGKRVLKIPPGTQAGTVVTLKNEGVPQLSHPERRGDQLVHLYIETPVKLLNEEKELYKRLAELRGEKLGVDENEKQLAKETGHHSILDAIAGVFKNKNNGD